VSHPEFDSGASSWLYFDKWLIARDAAEQSRKAGLNLASQVAKSKEEARWSLAEVTELRKAMRTLSNDYNTLSAALAERDDDLECLIDTLDFNLQEPGFAQKALDKRHAELKARAEEGGE